MSIDEDEREAVDAHNGLPLKPIKPKTITEDQFMEHCDSNDGLCLACGEWKFGDCEPDAEGYKCDDCGAMQVIGAENAMVMGLVLFGSEDESEE